MGFITEDFLLQSDTARHLYRKYASNQPILDYHCHLPAQEIAQNRRFQNLFEIWLEGDHYKWRAMRSNGEPEDYCTGPADPYEKFLAWARTVPYTLRNPLYHWTHLELQRYFNISELLDETTARAIWNRANQRLTTDPRLTAQGILSSFRVTAVCTTDDPTDSLEAHAQLQASGFATAVYPTFRPDRALRISNPAPFNVWVTNLSQRVQIPVKSFSDFLAALKKRHDDFHQLGCRLSDHGLDRCYSEPCTEAEAAAIFDRVRRGETPDSHESIKYASYMMVFFGRLDAEKGWTKQLHLGAYRNVNPTMLSKLGRDSGFDSIGDWPQAQSLGNYLSQLDRVDALPRTIIYNANPSDNYAFATMVGNFQNGTIAGKVQFGAAWWFLDQKEAIEWQLNALSNCALLSRFIGMVTDSRSFMSYPRHEYFRRILCNLLGNEMESGLLPNDEALVGAMVKRICYQNAVEFLNLPARARAVSASFKADGAPKHQAAKEGVLGREAQTD